VALIPASTNVATTSEVLAEFKRAMIVDWHQQVALRAALGVRVEGSFINFDF
jgi:hypothetical protein